MSSVKPLIVISYAHADEPEHPAEGEVKWLSFVTGYLRPTIKHGAVDLWIDRLMSGGERLGGRDRREVSRLRHLHPARLAPFAFVGLRCRQGNSNHPRAAGERRGRPFLSTCPNTNAENRARPRAGQEPAPARRQAFVGLSAARTLPAYERSGQRAFRPPVAPNAGARRGRRGACPAPRRAAVNQSGTIRPSGLGRGGGGWQVDGLFFSGHETFLSLESFLRYCFRRKEGRLHANPC